MRILGALLAGGRSRRFGSDKATALLGTHSLFERVAATLGAQTEAVVICGREWPAFTMLGDRPRAGLGPLGGLNAALHHADAAGFDAVLCAPVDVLPLPSNLRQLLEGSDAAVLARQHAVGFWPARFGPALDRYLAQGDRAFGGWIAASHAIRVADDGLALENINVPDDLLRLGARLPRD